MSSCLEGALLKGGSGRVSVLKGGGGGGGGGGGVARRRVDEVDWTIS